MENVIDSRIIPGANKAIKKSNNDTTNLAQAETNKEYVIKEVKTNDEELRDFLFTLGCYEGEIVTVMSVLGENYVISVKDSRYSIDKNLAETIIV